MQLRFVVLIAVGLSGCVSEGQRVVATQTPPPPPSEDQQCEGMGYHKGTELYLQCRKFLSDRETAQANAYARRPTFGDQLQHLGAALRARDAQMPPMQPPRMTNCVPNGLGGMNCTTL